MASTTMALTATSRTRVSTTKASTTRTRASTTPAPTARTDASVTTARPSVTRMLDTWCVPEERQHGAQVVLHHRLEQQLWRPPDLQEVPKQPLVLQSLRQSRMMRQMFCGII